ncbi:hypothetical protein D3C78_559660 [compost metagenome]
MADAKKPTPSSTASRLNRPTPPAVMTSYGKLMSEKADLLEQKLNRSTSASKPKQS